VYLVGENKRLVLQPVVVSFVQEEIAVIGEGLQGGESLVLTDVIPAVAGALLVPKEDASAREALLASATRGAVER